MSDDAPTVDAWSDRDEGRHQPRSDGPGWSESFAFELVTADGFGVAVHVTMHPFERRTWYWCVVARPDEPVVAIVDLDVPLPARAASLELRTDGLWADHNIETPWRHVSVGLEAFGLALEDPSALLGTGWGERVPVGLDLEWETEPGDVRAPADVGDPTSAAPEGYEIAGRAHGELLLGADAHELDGAGWREHRWGPIDWWDPVPTSRSWVAGVGSAPAAAKRLRGRPPDPAQASLQTDEVPIDRSQVEFPLSSIGDRAGTFGLGLVRRSDDTAPGAGWRSWRAAPPAPGRRP